MLERLSQNKKTERLLSNMLFLFYMFTAKKFFKCLYCLLKSNHRVVIPMMA